MAGFTTVSATVLDPTNLPYANGTWTANFVDPGTPGKTPLINGSIITRVYAGDLDSFGAFTVSLPDNAVIGTQTGAINTQWTFTFVNKSAPVGLGAPPAFSTGPITITGATQNITSIVQAAAASLNIGIPALAANQTWTGVNTFTGANVISAQDLEGIKFADQFAGADLGAKINAADAALGNNGGQIWVRKAAGTTINTAVTLHNSLIFIDAASYTVNQQISIPVGGITIQGLGFFNTGTSAPGTLLTWGGSAGTDMISILGTSGNRLDKVVLKNLILDGANSARYTCRIEKADICSFYDVRLKGGATACCLAVDATGIKWYNVGLTNIYAYGLICSWGTGGFGWIGGQAQGQVSNANPYVYLEGTINNWSCTSVEFDATNSTFNGFIQTNGYDTNSSIASVPTGHPGAPSDVYLNQCSFIYQAGSGAAGQGADVLVTGTASNNSQDVHFVMCTFLGLNIGQIAVKFDQAKDSGVLASISSGHTTGSAATMATTGNSTRIHALYVASSDTNRLAGGSTVVDLYQSNSFTLNCSNSNLAGVGPIAMAPSSAITNAVLTGASSGNNVTLLNYQTAKAAITGTGADAALYTYSLPANTVATGKGLRITASWSHSTGAASVVYKLKINGTALAAPGGITTAGAHTLTLTVMAAASTTFDLPTFWIATGSTLQSTTGSSTSSGGMSWTSNQTIELDFNVAATDQVTPGSFVVELIQ